MRLKELIAALETHQVDPKTGHQLIGERPEIPVQVEDRMVDIVLYINHDEITDHRLLKAAKVMIGKYGDIPVIRAGYVTVPMEVEVEKIVQVPVPNPLNIDMEKEIETLQYRVKELEEQNVGLTDELKDEKAKAKKALAKAKKAAEKADAED